MIANVLFTNKNVCFISKNSRGLTLRQFTDYGRDGKAWGFLIL